MTQERKYEIRYLGQIIILLALEVLILLVRIAVPVSSAIEGIGAQHNWFIGESIYFAIQAILVIVLMNHLIFKNEYKDMGIINFKDNIFSLLGNIVYLGIVGSITLILGFIGEQNSSYDIIKVVMSIIIVFMSTAFLQEVIYRGCIQRAFVKATSNPILSVICSSIVFTVTYIVLGLISSGFNSSYLESVNINAMMGLGIGVYFGTLYYVTNNLWICIIMHGTYMSIDVVGNSFLLYPFKIVYVIGAVGYLVYEVLSYRKKLNNNNEEFNLDSKVEERIDSNKDSDFEEASKFNEDSKSDENLEMATTSVDSSKVEVNTNQDFEEIEDISKNNRDMVIVENESVKSNEIKQINNDITNAEELNIDLSYQMVDESKEILKQIVDDEKNNPKQQKFNLHKEKIDDFGQTRDVSLIDLNKELKRDKHNLSLDEKVNLNIQDNNIKTNLKELKDGSSVDLNTPLDLLSEATTLYSLDVLEEELEALTQDQNKVNNKHISEDVNKDLSKTSIIKVKDIENSIMKAQLSMQMEEQEASIKEAIDKIDKRYMSHLERSLGNLIDIYPQIIPTDPPISILAFEGVKFNALVTSGMRQEAMMVPEYLKSDAYAELVMFISKEFDLSKQGMLVKENSWLLDALRELAIYPRATTSYLGWGHTVGNGEKREPYNVDTKLCGMLIYPPVMQDDMTFYTFKEEDKTTYIYDVMPLYTEEMDFILNHSGDLYFTKLKELGVSQIIEKNRRNICESDTPSLV